MRRRNSLNVQRLLFILSVVFIIIFHFEKLLNIKTYYLYFSTTPFSYQVLRLLLYGLFLTLGISMFSEKRIFLFLGLVLSSILNLQFNYGADVFIFNLTLFLAFIGNSSKDDFLKSCGYLLMLSHLTVIYIYNGVNKLTDSIWLNGKVIEFYLTPKIGFLQGVELDVGIARFISLSVVVLQFSILLIWFKKLRKLIAILFILKHSFIAFFLHPFFGVVCVLTHFHVYFYKGNAFKDTLKGLEKS